MLSRFAPSSSSRRSRNPVDTTEIISTSVEGTRLTPTSLPLNQRPRDTMSSLQNPSIVLYGPGDARFEDRPAPRITDPMDAIIRIKYVGVCGSDVNISSFLFVLLNYSPSTVLFCWGSTNSSFANIFPCSPPPSGPFLEPRRHRQQSSYARASTHYGP